MARSVLRQRDFVLLLGGQTVSGLGSQITDLAFPTLAILQFHASAGMVGLLIAAERAPFPILSLVAGVLLDPIAKRPVMIACNLIRLGILAAVPLLAIMGSLALWHLFVAAAGMGTFSVFFDIAYLAYVPSLVAGPALQDANSKLEMTFSTASLFGPGIGGLLIQAVGAARAVAIDAASFAVSAVTIALIRTREVITKRTIRPRLRTDMAEGLRHVFGSPVLRAQILCMTAAGTLGSCFDAPFYIFAYTQLHVSAAFVGLLYASQGVGSLGGALVAPRVIRWLGVGRVITLADAAAIAVRALVPLALWISPGPLLFPVFIAAGAAGSVGNITQVTLRQSLSPPHLQARMTSVFRTFFWGGWPLGNLIGGLAAAFIGAPMTLWTTATLGTLANLSIRFTPLWRVRTFGDQRAATADIGENPV